MPLLTRCLIGLVALQHLGFLVLEMFLWSTPWGMKVFKLTASQAEATKVLAANQGLYNGFLAAGLLWALLHTDSNIARQLAYFFLGCVIVAGIFGAVSASGRIFWLQSMPALIAAGLLYLSANSGVGNS